MAKVHMSMQEKNDFAMKNMGLIHAVAHEYDTSPYPYEERFQVASIGFTKALNTYDDSYNTKLSTYCVECMKNELGCMHRKATAACRSSMTNVSIDAEVCSTSNNKIEKNHYDLLPYNDSLEDDTITSITLKTTFAVMQEILPSKQYCALMMVAEGYSYAEIAMRTADSLENIRKLIRNARNRLRNDPRIHR